LNKSLLGLQGAEYDEFKSTATKIEDVFFAQTTDANAAKAAGLTKPGIAAVKNFAGRWLPVVWHAN
jgi:hypothetical protein